MQVIDLKEFILQSCLNYGLRMGSDTSVKQLSTLDTPYRTWASAGASRHHLNEYTVQPAHKVLNVVIHSIFSNLTKLSTELYLDCEDKIRLHAV